MLRVLTYHRVANPQDSPLLNSRLISATPTVFAQQITYLSKHYEVVSMEEVLHSVKRGMPLPKRAVLITFDDAYEDFADIAWPILKHYRLPATLFVPTAYPDQPERTFWCDRLYRAVTHTSQSVLSTTPLGLLSLHSSAERQANLRRLQSFVKRIPHAEAAALIDDICVRLGHQEVIHKSVLGWNDLRRLASEGVTLGAHTRTHAFLTQLSPAQARQEIRGSQSDLQREIACTLPIFSYPGGLYSDRIVDMAKEEGMVLAFTTRDGHNDLRTADLLRLRRTNITRRTSLSVFSLRLLRIGAYLDAWRHRDLQPS